MLAIIGGSGLGNIEGLEIIRREIVRTPYGQPSEPLIFGNLGGKGRRARDHCTDGTNVPVWHANRL